MHSAWIEALQSFSEYRKSFMNGNHVPEHIQKLLGNMKNKPATRGLPLGGETAFDPSGINPAARQQYIDAIRMNEQASNGTLEDYLGKL